MYPDTRRNTYTLPELPPRATPQLEHRGFREQGIGAARERRDKLWEKHTSLNEAERQVGEDARRRWIDAFADLKDAGEVQRDAKREMNYDKDIVTLQKLAARVFADVQWELRSAMVRCSRCVLSSKASLAKGLVPDEYFHRYMEQLAQEEKGLKRKMLQYVAGDAGAADVHSGQAGTSTLEEMWTDNAEGVQLPGQMANQYGEESEQVPTERRDVNAANQQEIGDTVAGLERKITLLQQVRQTAVSLAGDLPPSTHGPATGLDNDILDGEDQDSRHEDRRRRAERSERLAALREEIATTVNSPGPRGSSWRQMLKMRAVTMPRQRPPWLEAYLRLNPDASGQRILAALTEKLVHDIKTLELHIEALQALSITAGQLPRLQNVVYKEYSLECDWVSSIRAPLHFPRLRRFMDLDTAPAPRETYEKLAKDQFRILILEPSPEPYYPLVCTLETWSMDDSNSFFPRPFSPSDRQRGRYAALSYWWGPEDNNGRIYMLRHDHGLNMANPDEWVHAVKMTTTIRIRNNLFRALLRFRRHGLHAEPVALWVDSICINQEDPEEKTVQLPRMVEIYSRASNVCIWLGESDDEGRSDRAMGFIADIMDFAVLDRYAHDKKQAEKWYALSELMRDRWFSRRWVVQEIALAQDATVHCGGSMVRWSDFSDAVALLVSNKETIRSLFDPAEWREGNNTLGDVGSFGAAILLEATSNLFLRKADGSIKRPTKGVEALVTSLTTFDASDPRDLIYSVVAIASDTSHRVWDTSPHPAAPFEFRANYDQSGLDAYKTFTKFCVLKSKSLDIICRPWAMPLMDAAGKALRVPSWIPQLSRSDFGAPEEIYSGRKNGEGLVGPAGSPTYRASGNRRNIADADTSDVRFPSDAGEDILLVKGVRLGRITQVSQRITGGVIFRESLQMIKWWGFGNGDGNVRDSVWRTLVADRGRDGRVAPLWYQRACMRCLEVADRFNNGDLNVGELLQGHSQMLREYLVRVRNVTWNRRFFATTVHDAFGFEGSGGEGTELGLCPPGTEVGDIVCILFGCSVPVILREADDGCVTLVGEAYVHGKMDGEAVEDLQETGDRRVEEFKIT